MKEVKYTVSVIKQDNAEIPHFLVKLGGQTIGTVHREGKVWYPLAMPDFRGDLGLEPKTRKVHAVFELVGKYITGP